MPVERESPLEASEPGRRVRSPGGGSGLAASMTDPSGPLAAALRAGDPAVLDRLLEAHGPELGGVAFLILRDRAEAEDVVVDTLLTALERGADLRDGAALRSWLLRIATNRALGRLRRRRRIVGIEVVGEESDDVFDPANAAIRATVLNAVNRLPPRMRIGNTRTTRGFLVVFDLWSPQRPILVLPRATWAAWSPDGRLGYVVSEALHVLDPEHPVETVVPLPAGLRLAEEGFAWLADGSGVLTSRWDPTEERDVPGILGLDGTHRSLEGTLPATFSSTGVPRRPSHGGMVGFGCDIGGAEGTVATCVVTATSGPEAEAVRW